MRTLLWMCLLSLPSVALAADIEPEEITADAEVESTAADDDRDADFDPCEPDDDVDPLQKPPGAPGPPSSPQGPSKGPAKGPSKGPCSVAAVGGANEVSGALLTLPLALLLLRRRKSS